MSADPGRSLRRCRGRLLSASPLVAALLAAIPAAPGALAQDAAGRAEGVDAEMLRDLEVLGSADYAREREVTRRLGLLERLRLLEALRHLESQPASGAPAAEGRPQREVK